MKFHTTLNCKARNQSLHCMDFFKADEIVLEVYTENERTEINHFRSKSLTAQLEANLLKSFHETPADVSQPLVSIASTIVTLNGSKPKKPSFDLNKEKLELKKKVQKRINSVKDSRSFKSSGLKTLNFERKPQVGGKKKILKSGDNKKILRNRVFVPVLTQKGKGKLSKESDGLKENYEGHDRKIDNSTENSKVYIDRNLQNKEPSENRRVLTDNNETARDFNSPAFLSPLKNLKKFASLTKPEENPYKNFDLAPSILKSLEELQRTLKFTESSQQSSFESSCFSETMLMDNAEDWEKPRIQAREPSFGFGGGDFMSSDMKVQENQLYCESNNVLEADSEKSLQTEESLNISELISIVTDRKFMKSLKVIGRFSDFLEKFCK